MIGELVNRVLEVDLDGRLLGTTLIM